MLLQIDSMMLLFFNFFCHSILKAQILPSHFLFFHHFPYYFWPRIKFMVGFSNSSPIILKERLSKMNY